MKKLIRLIHLFRIFFPSWKFFDQAGAGPRLMYQLSSQSEESWFPVLPEPSHGIQSLMLNPQGNLLHAYQSLTERLLSEIETMENPEAIENSVSYRLIEQLVRIQILETNSQFKNQTFRFKILIRRPQVQDVLISGTHEV